MMAMRLNFNTLPSALLKAAFLLGVSSLLSSQAGWASWNVDSFENGKAAYSAWTTGQTGYSIGARLYVVPISNNRGCATFIEVSDYNNEIVELDERNWFEYRFDTKIDGKEVLISGKPLDYGGFYIFNGSSARRAMERDWPRIQKRERLKTLKLLSEGSEFVIELPLEIGDSVFEISLEGADDAIKEACS